jgi:23S rRNA (guanosine2251-2'-O)-methyltransferase
VRELLAADRRRVRTVWIATSAEETATLQDIAALAAERQVPVSRVERFRLDQVALTEAPQGVVAWADPVPVVELDALIHANPGGPAPFVLVLDGVTDPHNVGALLRSAACAGATGAVIPKHRSAHLTPSAVKAAAGAVEHLPISLVAGIPSALRVMADAGLWTVGLEVGASARLWDLPVAGAPIALVVGAEGKGLAKLVRDRCELLVSIHQAGPLDSLNVSAAGALALFEVARGRLT